MTRSHSNPLVESFGPELLAALLSAATGSLPPVTLPYNKAVRFRQRLYQLRNAMRKAKHEKYHLVCRVRITIEWDGKVETMKAGEHYVPVDKRAPCRVTLTPNDSEFSSALKAAGLDTSLGADPVAEVALSQPEVAKERPSELDALEALLGEIGK